MAMMGIDEVRFLPNSYKDFIHDTAFNIYGTRMATCSSDGYVRVRHYFSSQTSFHIHRFN